MKMFKAITNSKGRKMNNQKRFVVSILSFLLVFCLIPVQALTIPHSKKLFDGGMGSSEMDDESLEIR